MLVAINLACLTAAAWGTELAGRVVSIADGDIPLRSLMRSAFSTRSEWPGSMPEKAQPFGQRARQSLAALVFAREVRVEWQKHDRYGRIVGQVWVAPPQSTCRDKPDCPKTLDAGLHQIASGMAWWYVKYAHEQAREDRALYKREETAARERAAGLWSEANPIPPWQWRHASRLR